MMQLNHLHFGGPGSPGLTLRLNADQMPERVQMEMFIQLGKQLGWFDALLKQCPAVNLADLALVGTTVWDGICERERQAMQAPA